MTAATLPWSDWAAARICLAPSNDEETTVACPTWLTVERTVAPATGAPRERRLPVAEAFDGSGMGKQLGAASISIRTNGHRALSRIAWAGRPLASRGDGYG